MSVIVLNTDNFDETIHQHDLVVVDFWAKWCAPCLAFAPIFEQVSERFPGIVFAKVDIESSPVLATDFKIQSIPMLMIFKQDIVVFAESGTQTIQSLSELVKSARILDMSQVLNAIKNVNPD